MEPVRLSIVVPVFNEEGNVERLADEIANACADTVYEMIFVDDASTDATMTALLADKMKHPKLRVLHHEHNAGQSRAIRTGALAAKGSILCILDGDGQNDPADLPALVAQFQNLKPEPGMVAGQRLRRQDTRIKRLGSTMGNTIRRLILRDGARDAGCGLKVMAMETYRRLPYFDHQHRYMAALVRREGLDVTYLPVGHRARLSGQSSYTNLGRLIVSVRDLLGVRWLQSRARNPGDIEER